MLYVVLVKGLASNTFSRFMQIAGILASLLSVAGTCCDWFIIGSFNDDKRQIEPGVWYSLKALAFFLPHVIFQTTSTAFTAAFLKWYSLIPLAGYLIVNMVITLVLKKKYDGDMEKAFFDYAFSLLTPAIGGSTSKHGRSQLKATMLSSTATLLLCLIFIQILQLLPTEFVSCSLGLHHLHHSDLDLDHSDKIPSCSPCFDLITVILDLIFRNEGTPCVMATSLDDFSYFFWPLIILGAWCLFEGDITFFALRLSLILILIRDRDDLQQEELAASLQMGRGSLDHGGKSRMTAHHTNISHNVHQDAEEFLKTPEGAQMLKTHQVEKEEQDENEEGSGLELQEATDGKSETI